MSILFLALLSVSSAAQDWTVSRRQHTFIGSRLTIEIQVDAPGALRVARGEAGRVTITARTRGGVVESGLAGSADDHLVLTAVATDRIELIVMVPEGVMTMIQLPNLEFPEVIGSSASASFSWPARGAAGSRREGG